MAKVQLPTTLRALRPITAAQVYAQYQALVAPLNAGLTYANLSPRARVQNASFREPYSLIGLRGWDNVIFGASFAYVTPYFQVPVAPRLDSKVTYYYVGYSAVWMGVITGSILAKKKAKDGTVTTIDTHVVTSGTDWGHQTSKLSSAVALSPGDLVYLDWSGATSTRVPALCETPVLWLKAIHVR